MSGWVFRLGDLDDDTAWGGRSASGSRPKKRHIGIYNPGQPPHLGGVVLPQSIHSLSIVPISAIQSPLERLTNCLLLLGIYGFVLSLLINRGTWEISLAVAAVGVLLALSQRDVRSRLRRPQVWLLGIGLMFLLFGWIMATRPIQGHEPKSVIGGLIMALAIGLAPARVSTRFSHADCAALLLMVFVPVQVVADLLGKQGYHDGLRGLYRNIHFLALYCVLTLPLLAYLLRTERGRARLLLGGLLLGDLWLLLQTHSRPGYLAVLVSALPLLPFLPTRWRWAALGTMLILPVGLYTSSLFGFSARIDDLATHFAAEERWTLWREFPALQASSSAAQWWLGHGFSQYVWDYQPFSSFHKNSEIDRLELALPSNVLHFQYDDPAIEKRDLTFPHNYLMEVLYSHGLLGLSLFVVAILAWIQGLVSGIRQSAGDGQRRLGLLLLSCTIGLLVFGFLTLPFFSRHNLHPLSVVLGLSLRYFVELRKDHA